MVVDRKLTCPWNSFRYLQGDVCLIYEVLFAIYRVMCVWNLFDIWNYFCYLQGDVCLKSVWYMKFFFAIYRVVCVWNLFDIWNSFCYLQGDVCLKSVWYMNFFSLFTGWCVFEICLICEILFCYLQGDEADNMYFIERGFVSVKMKSPVSISFSISSSPVYIPSWKFVPLWYYERTHTMST